MALRVRGVKMSEIFGDGEEQQHYSINNGTPLKIFGDQSFYVLKKSDFDSRTRGIMLCKDVYLKPNIIPKTLEFVVLSEEWSLKLADLDSSIPESVKIYSLSRCRPSKRSYTFYNRTRGETNYDLLRRLDLERQKARLVAQNIQAQPPHNISSTIQMLRTTEALRARIRY